MKDICTGNKKQHPKERQTSTNMGKKNAITEGEGGRWSEKMLPAAPPCGVTALAGNTGHLPPGKWGL